MAEQFELDELVQRVAMLTEHDEILSRVLTTGKLRCWVGTGTERTLSTDYHNGVFWWESDNNDLYQGTGTAWQHIGGASRDAYVDFGTSINGQEFTP